MKVYVYEGKLNGEHHLKTVDTLSSLPLPPLPQKNEKICIEDDVYVVNDILINYDKNCVDIFVKLYDWE